MNDEKRPLIVDAHLDLSMNAIEWNRDLRWTVTQVRERERGLQDKPDRGKGTVTLPSMREGNVGLCVATLIARYVKQGSKLPGWHSPEQAWAQTQGQLSWYRAMEEVGQMTQIKDLKSLNTHLALWENPPVNAPIGYVLSLEGADSICTIGHLERAYEQGLRAIGPAHYGPGTYAQGTDATGGIGAKGKELLKEIERLGIILDATHLCDDSFWEAMGVYNGPVWASHNNCRSLVPHNRQFSDEQIKELISRGAVIGAALDAWMMVPNWVRGKSTPVEMNVSLETMVDHIDHICQLAGNSEHAAIGTDLDGAFGTEQGPKDLDTIADLQKLPEILKSRGYTAQDVLNITSANWIRFLRKTWS
ncbi:membrane dipeptidase [Reichenbachiella agarivorans]|uniref:Membrane dipeptidase n=1 Tax=Reichenbachiella agarivorans TaxID=2979464 RepID=A0ABY6CJ74_9BACT|nr:membrane dipeptidase [Reichenbachiella agarivorans]UXP30581.1 membrane dipeptidase [Reichenbachiella agarivorans]